MNSKGCTYSWTHLRMLAPAAHEVHIAGLRIARHEREREKER